MAIDHKARRIAQQIGSRLERLEMRDGLVDQKRRLGAGALDAEDRDEGRLAGGGVGADRLAGFRGRALDIEQIVGDLEGEAEIMGIAAQRQAQLLRRLAENRARPRRRKRSARRSSCAAAA